MESGIQFEDKLAPVRLHDVCKNFVDPEGNELQVLEDISLEVHAGEFVVIVGPSGCGKTTLLRILQGLDTPSSGELDVPGRGRESGGRTGFVFQRASLLPWRSVRSNIRLGLDFRSGKRGLGLSRQEADERVDQLLEMMGISDFGSYRPFQISGGMQQRVNLARALAVQPTVLLMDEPFSALDAQTRERLQRELATIVSELSTTVVFITHDIREAVYLADRVVIMSARPGRFREVVPIEHPRPRDADFQQGPELAKHTRYIWHLLHDS